MKEASPPDQFNMTKNRLEFDQKNFTPTNMTNMTKTFHQQTLTFKLDRNIDEFDRKLRIT